MRDVRRDVMSFIRAFIRMWQVFIPNKKKKIMTLTFNKIKNYNASSDYQKL